jgi:hypothetical protein
VDFEPIMEISEGCEKKELCRNDIMHFPVGVDTYILLYRCISHITVHVSASIGLVFDACAAFNIYGFQHIDEFHCCNICRFVDSGTTAYFV